MSTWVEDIVQALKNLGGQATLDQICEEVKRIRTEPLPITWRAMINHIIGDYSSDKSYFKGYKGGKDLFQEIGDGVWALRNFEQKETTKENIKKRTLGNQPSKQDFIKFLPPESNEEIVNILRTIKQYRDYQSPDHLAWKEYIKEFFHILGFATEEINPRLYSLDVLGSNHTPEAVLLVLHPGENLEEMVPGLTWESYCFLAAHYYRVKWGIITNGIQLKILSYD